jgi:hypothetical protein
MTPADSGRAKRRPGLAVLRLVVIVGLILLANHALHAIAAMLEVDLRPESGEIMTRLVVVASVIYVITLALPFVPGVEIGLALITALGVQVVPLVYGCTVAGLLLGFLIGRLVPMRLLIRFSHDLHLGRVESLLTRFASIPEGEKLTFVLAASSSRVSRGLLRHRYLALALAIALPGNFVIGGGGGIAMLAGASRLFPLPWFLLTVALAVAPVPLAMLLFGARFFAE